MVGMFEIIWIVGFLVLGLITTIFWIWMLLDCALHESNSGNDKIVWILIILLTHVLGAAMYFVIRRPQRITDMGG